jgi:hypothetical protein
MATGAVDVWRLDPARFPLGGGSHRRVVGSRNWTCWGVTPVDVRPPMVFAIATPTKPACNGAPPVHRGARLLLRRRRSAARSSSPIGSRMIQGCCCNF